MRAWSDSQQPTLTAQLHLLLLLVALVSTGNAAGGVACGAQCTHEFRVSSTQLVFFTYSCECHSLLMAPAGTKVRHTTTRCSTYGILH